MKRLLNLLLAVLAVCLLLGLAGCSDDTDDLGVVARVNGHPIALSDLEFLHDLQSFNRPALPSVDALRSEYGDVLSDLIVLELVRQELVERGIPVSPEELKAAEDKIRADYPDQASFEQVLVEEYIDLDTWRRFLAYHQTVEKFNSQILRPMIKIDYKEAEAYYRDHLNDFYLPTRLRLLVIWGPGRELVERAAKIYAADGDAAALADKFKNVNAREVVMAESKLPSSWKNALTGLKPKEPSPVLSDVSGFESLVIEESVPARLLDPSQAYPLVEEALLSKKMRDAFTDWLQKRLAESTISISELLLREHAERQKEKPRPDHFVPPEPEEPPAVAPADIPPDRPEEVIPPDEVPPGPEVPDEHDPVLPGAPDEPARSGAAKGG